MIINDPIGDMLTRIRNAIAVNQRQISLPHSKLKETVAKILADNGFLKSASISGTGVTKMLDITIASESASATISEIKRLSTPGRRMYAGANEIPVVRRGRGLVVVSTSQGVMSGNQARDKRLGGELICEVY